MNFSCPVCHLPLWEKEGSFRCANRHCFDRSSAGYVNLLPSNHKNSKDPGDAKGMITARRSFLSKEYYRPLLDALSALSLAYCREKKLSHPVLLDAGCGEGYYTDGVCSALQTHEIFSQGFGVDISKHAAQWAAKRRGLATYAVASVFSLPFFSNSVDLMLSIFAPFAKEECLRVLRPGGMLLYVYPDQEHLMGLKKVLYDTARDNPPYDLEKVSQKFASCIFHQLSYDITVAHEDLEGLFQMTPYYWKSPMDASMRLQLADQVKTKIAFCILELFKPEKK